MISHVETVQRKIETQNATIELVDHYGAKGMSYTVCDNCYYLVRQTIPEHIDVAIEVRKTAKISCGSLSFYPANLPFVITPKAEWNGISSIRCQFEPHWFSSIAKLPLDWNGSLLEHCFNLRNDRIDRAVMWMGHEARDPSFASDIVIDMLAGLVAQEFSREFELGSPDLRIRTTGMKLSTADYNRVVEYIICYTHRTLSLTEIARACGISESLLAKSFKESSGTTVHKYVEHVRLTKAKDMLKTSDLPLKEIANRVGFSGSSAFCFAFKKKTGETPSEYRLSTRT